MAPGATAREVKDQRKAKVFISYSRKDMAFADRLDAALKARGFEALIDRTDIYAFEEWWNRVKALIGRADTVVFVLSPDAVRPDTVALKEVAFAASLNKRFAPIVCRPVEDSAVPEALAKLHFIFFDDAERFEQSADLLAEALNTDIGWIRKHTEYGEAERRWSAAGHPMGLLLHPPTLEVAEHWIISRPRAAPEPTVDIRRFIVESRRTARAAHRLRRLVRVSMFTLLTGIILSLFAWMNQSYVAAQLRWYRTERPFLTTIVWPYVLRPRAEQELKPGNSFRECAADQKTNYCPQMIVVPAGSFIMGSSTQPQHAYEEPAHIVTIGKPLAVAVYELTFDEWDTCVAYGDCDSRISDSGFGRGRQPVINVSWDDARQYVRWLARVTGKPYRLLSESEYEYAARAGASTAYPWGDKIGENNASCFGCGSKSRGRERPAPPGSFPPNLFGLYDMVGNVWEWVEDCALYDPMNTPINYAPADGSPLESSDCKHRLIRGGSYDSGPDEARLARRYGRFADSRDASLGFRVARTLLAP
jgi:formylglycine-generating enzyme required for sulfatase activity